VVVVVLISGLVGIDWGTTVVLLISVTGRESTAREDWKESRLGGSRVRRRTLGEDIRELKVSRILSFGRGAWVAMGTREERYRNDDEKEELELDSRSSPS